MNCKAKGSRNERRTIKLLESVGYSCLKAGASLGVFDVVGISSAEMVCVQVKSNRWPSSAEMETIQLFPVPPNCRKLVHRWDDRKSLPQTKEVD